MSLTVVHEWSASKTRHTALTGKERSYAPSFGTTPANKHAQETLCGSLPQGTDTTHRRRHWSTGIPDVVTMVCEVELRRSLKRERSNER